MENLATVRDKQTNKETNNILDVDTEFSNNLTLFSAAINFFLH